MNLGNTEEIEIQALAEKAIDAVDADSEIVCRPLPKDNPEVRRPGIFKAVELLKWQPTVSLRDGLVETAPYFLDQLGHE